MKGILLVRAQFIGPLAPRRTLDVQGLGDAVVDCYEATLVDVVRYWHEASLLQNVECSVMPTAIFAVDVAFPPGHVQIATDDVHGVAGRIDCLVDRSGKLIGACLRLLCVLIV